MEEEHLFNDFSSIIGVGTRGSKFISVTEDEFSDESILDFFGVALVDV